jgi:hypothetical protein
LRNLVAAVAFLLAGLSGLTRRWAGRPIIASLACALGLAVSACGGASSGSGSTTYTVTIIGKDTTDSTLSASTSMFVTID